MGSKFSLPDRIDKDTFIYVTGEFFTEKLWTDYSRNDFIPRNKLLCMERVHDALLEDPNATDIYEGGLYSNERDGYGLYIYPSGDVYDGEWKAGERHGYGRFTDMTSGDVLSGQWVRDQLTGEGRVEESSGPIHGRGHGKLVPSVGNVYEGGLKENMKCGYGTMVYSKTIGEKRGEVYEGEWVEDVRHGHGVCKYANGNVYDGAWINDLRCGAGTLRFRNGDFFAGNFSNNLLHGAGTYTPHGGAPVAAEWIRGDRVVEEVEVEAESSVEEDDEERFDFGDDNYNADL